MPPRRRKVVCDDEEAVPAKKSRQKTETLVTNRAEKNRSSGSKNEGSVSLAGLSSPAKKLRRKLNLKEGLDVEVSGINCVVEDVEEETESKYFKGGDIAAVPRKKKETKSQNKSAPKKSDSGKGEKSGGNGSLESQKLVQAKRKGKGTKPAEVVSTSKSGMEEESKDEQIEEEGDVSKRKTQRKRVSKSKAKADGLGQSSEEVNLNAKKNTKPSAVSRPKKKSASVGGRGGGRGGRRGGGGRGEGGREAEGGLERKEKPLADASSSSDSESEWEEVEELPGVGDDDEPWKSQLPDKPVQIILDASELVNKKRKKGGFDVKEYFRLQLNRFRTETQKNAHKVHLLCLLSHGRFKNWVCCSVMLQSIALSLVPPEFTGRSHDTWMFQQLSMFTRWFKKTILIDDGEPAKANVDEQLSDQLMSRFSERKALSEQELILMFTISCRSIGLLTRLVYSLQPITFKPADLKKNKQAKNAATSVQKKKTESKKNSKNNSQKSKTKTDSTTDQNSQEIIRSSSSASVNRNSSVDEDSQSEESRSKALTQSHSPSGVSIKKGEESLPRTEDNILKTKNRRPRRSGSKVNYDKGAKNADLESEEDDWKEEMGDVLESSSLDTESESDGRSSGNRKRNRSSDDDFEESKVAFRRSASSAKKLTKRQKRRLHIRQKFKQISSVNCEIADEDQSLAFGSDWWTEVYLENEHKWICVNGSQLQLNHPESVEQSATEPLSYIVAFDNGDGIKDITKKYASDWLSSVKKIRLDELWWKNVLAPFQKADCERDVKEEAYVHEQLLKKPMPTTISDFKNHSLYALKRHLLKYEAIYPPTAPILGHIRGEPVYPRDCVHCLHAREKWRIEGRLVTIGEEPYKIVKARPKWNKPKEFNDRLKLSLFGHWQTEEFIPVPALDGKIPKNEYGNVEVFKPWMIPGGTIYLPETMNGLGRVAKKLDVDIAPAMVGWDFHGGFNHPILQGWIVCEEHRDILVAAWEEDQAIQQQKEAEKKQQRILSNWKTLIRGLLIRERLKKRFNLVEPTVSKKKRQVVDLDADDSEEENSEDKAMKEQALSWPENLKKRKKEEEKEKKESGKAVDSKHNLFPFEKDHQLSSSAKL